MHPCCCNAGGNATEYDQVHALAQKPVSEVGVPLLIQGALSIPMHIRKLMCAAMLPAGNPECGSHNWLGGIQSQGWGYVCAIFTIKVVAYRTKAGLKMHGCLQAWLLHPHLYRRMTTDCRGKPVALHLS